jgi:hypothetical protein
MKDLTIIRLTLGLKALKGRPTAQSFVPLVSQPSQQSQAQKMTLPDDGMNRLKL